MECVAAVIPVMVASLGSVCESVESCHSRAQLQLSCTVQKTGFFVRGLTLNHLTSAYENEVPVVCYMQ